MGKSSIDIQQNLRHEVLSPPSLPRSIRISTSSGQQTFAVANIEESGNYDDVMNEWTVYFLTKNHSKACPLNVLSNLGITVNNGNTGYFSSFVTDRERIVVRVYSVMRQEEKSFTLTLGNEMIIVGRVYGWPEARSPEDTEQDEDFHGTMGELLQHLESDSWSGVEIKFGFAVLKNFCFSSEFSSGISDDSYIRTNWETFG